MKRGAFHEYRREDTLLAESALLTVWPKLADFHEDIVLIGGLVPRYLCKPRREDLEPRTLDVDLGIALAAGGGLYEPLSRRLESDGFELKNGRFEKAVGTGTLFIDFLTERPTADSPKSVVVDDVPTTALLGVDRALANHRRVRIEGHDLARGSVREEVKVCEIGPFLCLKLQAYALRAERKDVFDVVYAVQAYDRSPEAAVRLFRQEQGINLAFPLAERILRERFADKAAKGPNDYAAFCLEGVPVATGDDLEARRSILAEDAVTVAHGLISA